MILFMKIDPAKMKTAFGREFEFKLTGAEAAGALAAMDFLMGVVPPEVNNSPIGRLGITAARAAREKMTAQLMAQANAKKEEEIPDAGPVSH